MDYNRLTWIILLIPVLVGTIFVNNGKAQAVKTGLTGGMNISSHLKNFRSSGEELNLNLSPKVTTGYQTGFLIRTKIAKPLRLQAEPSFIVLGARYDEPFTLRESEFHTQSRTRLYYLQLPLLLQLSTVPPEKTVYGLPFTVTTYHLTGGVFGGYLLDARFSGTNTGEPVGISFENNFSNNVTSQYKEYDGGAVIGVGLEHGHSKKIGFETRAWYSIFDSGNVPDFYFKPQNMAITFSVYFLL